MIEIHVKMLDGTVWAVPAEVVAKDSAKYYSGLDGGGTFDQETAQTLMDDDELLDWASNNMDWSDVEKHARCIVRSDLNIDYQEGWVNGDKTVERTLVVDDKKEANE